METKVAPVASLPDVAETEREESAPHMSRGFKIENVADVDAPQLFSVDALAHAISGSIGGNVAMSGLTPISGPWEKSKPCEELMIFRAPQHSILWTNWFCVLRSPERAKI